MSTRGQGSKKRKVPGEAGTSRKGRGEQGVDNISSPGVEQGTGTVAAARSVETSSVPRSVPTRPSKRVQQAPKLKTLTDIAYDIMAAAMSASLGNSKAKVYDYWIDMAAAEKQKYIGQARAAVKAMSPAELKGVQLTAEEIAELGAFPERQYICSSSPPLPLFSPGPSCPTSPAGIVIVKEPSVAAPAAAPVAEAEAEAAALSSGVEDDARIKYREWGGGDDAAQEARRNARNSRGRLLQSKPSIASLQSLTGSFVEDDEALADDASDNYADMDIVNDESGEPR